MNENATTTTNGRPATGPISRVANAARNVFRREPDPAPVEDVPAEPGPEPEPAARRSWTPPKPPERPPTPFDERIAETEREAEACQTAWEHTVDSVFAAVDEMRRVSSAQPPDPRELARARRAHDEARARQSEAGAKLQRARVRLHALQHARSRWVISTW